MLLTFQFVLAYISIIYCDEQFEHIANKAAVWSSIYTEDLAIIRLTGGFVEY